MTLLFFREALKFYKLKSERLVQVLFLLVLGINLFAALQPFGDNDFSGFFRSVDELLLAVRMGRSPDWSDLYLTSGNLITLAIQGLALLFNLLLLLLYAGAYSAERIGAAGSKGAVAMLKAWPKCLVVILLLALVAGMTSFLMFIPFAVLASGFSFSFFFFSEKKLSLGAGLSRSWRATMRRKLIITLNVISVRFILSFLSNLLLALFAPWQGARLWLLPLITTVTVLICGRLLGLMYVFFTRQTFTLGQGKTTLVISDVQVLFEDELAPLPDDLFLQKKSGRQGKK